MGRDYQSEMTDEQFYLFEYYLMLGFSISYSAGKAGISNRRLYRMRQKDKRIQAVIEKYWIGQVRCKGMVTYYNQKRISP